MLMQRQVKGSTAVQSASLVPSTPLPGQTGSLSHAPLVGCSAVPVLVCCLHLLVCCMHAPICNALQGPGGGHKNAETSLVVYGLVRCA